MATWKNKIVGHAEVDPASLLAHERNWRGHPAFQKNALTGTIRKVGFIHSVLVSKRTGKIIDGHLRVALALEQKQPRVPVEYVDLTPEQEKLALATFDPIGDLAQTEAGNLDELLADIDPMLAEEGLASLLEQMGQVGEIEEPEAPEESEKRPAMAKPIKLTAEQRELLETVFARFREKHGSDGGPMSEGQIVEMIGADWLAGN